MVLLEYLLWGTLKGNFQAVFTRRPLVGYSSSSHWESVIRLHLFMCFALAALAFALVDFGLTSLLRLYSFVQLP